jgi:hypothetical protein
MEVFFERLERETKGAESFDSNKLRLVSGPR